MALVNLSHANQTISSNWSSTISKSIELQTFKIVFQTFIAIVGVLGNLAVCVVVTRNKHTKTSTELLIRNLAIADLGILLVIFPLAVMKERIPYQWPLGEFFCLYLYPCSETFYGVSVWTIVVIAVERYRHLVCPAKLRERRKTITFVKRVIVCLWSTCFIIFSLPAYPFMMYKELQGHHIICAPNFKSFEIFKAIMIFRTITWYCLPLIIILFSYNVISKKINQSNIFLKSLSTSETNLPGLPGNNRNRMSMVQRRRLQQNRRVKKILTPVVVAFAVLMLPLTVLNMIVVFDQRIQFEESYSHLIYFISTCIILGSSINPVIYSFTSPGFRAGLRAFLKDSSFRVFIGSAIRPAEEKKIFKMRP